MSTTEQHSASVEELLTPVKQSIDLCADDPSRAGQAQQTLLGLADAVESAADESWLLAVRTLARLFEIVECFADDTDEQMTQVSQEIVAFVQSSFSLISTSLEEPLPESMSRILELVDKSHECWGDYLTLVDSGPVISASSLDEEVCSRIDEERNDLSSASPHQVDLILSALGGSVEVTEEVVALAAPEEVSEEHPSQPAPPPANDHDGPVTTFAPQHVEMDPELLEAYLEDAQQCLSSMERSALAYEQNSSTQAPIQQLQRDLHTLKGASASVGLNRLAEHIHGVEEWLQSQENLPDQVQLDPVLACVDAVRSQVDALSHRTAPQLVTQTASPSPIPTPASTLPISIGHDRADEPGDESVRVRSSQLDRLMDILVELVTWRRRRDQRVLEIERAAEELNRCTLRLESAANQQDLGQGSGLSAGGDGASTDEQRNRKSLQEITSDVREIATTLTSARQSMMEENRSVTHFMQEFRQQLVELRRLPLTGLFQRLQRVARDAARVEQKQVRLEFVGEHAGLERSLQERLYEPLLHLVRNAVGHGIESPEDRLKMGKSSEGTITLEAYGSSHLLILEIRDDGAGLDFDAIRKRGHERGLLPTDRTVSEQDLSRLIFHPGFSTRNETNAVAGRGVGMDVVSAALDRCNCQIEINSIRGKGTTFRLNIPLSSVVEPTLIFRAGGQLFGLPTPFVQATSHACESIWPPKQPTGRQRLSLADVLGVAPAEKSITRRTLTVRQLAHSRESQNLSQGISQASSNVEQIDQLSFAIDELVGTEEVVVRPLPPLLRRHPLLSGVSLSGAGEIVLLLDGNRFIQAGTTITSNSAADSSALSEDVDSVSPRRLLVADDSLSARKRLVQTLASYGFEITEVSDGAEALDVLRTETFDAVFSDLEMPRMSGFDLLTELKGGNRQPCEPVVLVTTRTESGTQARAQQLGADGFLAKPVSAESVEDILRKLDMIPVTKN